MTLNDQSPEAQAFLDKHVLARANSLVEDLLNKGITSWEYPDQYWHQDLFCQVHESDIHQADDFCPSEELDFRKPYEFYIVTEYLAFKLKENNQLVTNQWGFWIWGRETTGQLILIDYVFQKIYNDFKNS